MKLPTSPDGGDITDLVWVATGFLGDIILATAGFELAAKHFPDVRQHVITTPLGVAALDGSLVLKTRIAFDKRGQSTWTAMRGTLSALRKALEPEARPLLLQVHRSMRSSLLTHLSRLPTVTYQESEWASHAVCRVSRVAPLHEAARIGLLLEPLGIARRDIVDARPVLPALPLQCDVAWQKRLKDCRTRGQRLVGIAPGSVWGTKRWTKNGFVELIQRILQETQDAVVLLGSSAEKNLCAELVSTLSLTHPSLVEDRLLDLSGATTLDDLRRIYPVLSSLVSNDSSPLHYGSAFNIPTVALFGATVPEMGFGPLASGSKTLGVNLSCRPCSDHGPQVCPLGHFRCMKDLSAERVLNALFEV